MFSQPFNSKISVKYSGPMIESSGYSKANRNIVKALNDCGVDVITEIQVYSLQNTDYGPKAELAKSLQNKQSDYKIKVLHITPNVYKEHKEPGKYHIGHLFWETTKMSPSWANCLDEVDEIWTGCEENAKTFKESGFNKPIFVFPQPIDTELEETTKPIEGAAGYKFYSVFQWIERKNPKALLQNFWREFSHGENVCLIIKSYGLGFNEREEERIKREAAVWKAEIRNEGVVDFPRILWIKDLLSEKEMGQLHNSCDCLISTHRFEGFGLPISESIAYGKPVISTNLGGVHCWIPDNGMFKIKYNLCEVFNMDWFAEQYSVPGNMWAEIDSTDLREKMRYVFENREAANKIGLTGQKYIKDNLNFKKIGKLMKNRLIEINKNL